MPSYKNIRVKKPNGGSRMQRVQVLKSGKYKFVKNKTRSVKTKGYKKPGTRRKRAAVSRTYRRATMARRRKKGSRRRQKIPLAATAGMLIGIKTLWDAYQGGGTNRALRVLTGYDMGNNNFMGWQSATATIPMVAGAAVSMVAAKAGLNRYIKVPFVKI